MPQCIQHTEKQFFSIKNTFELFEKVRGSKICNLFSLIQYAFSFLCFMYSFLLFYFSISRLSSASSLPLTVQTWTGLPLNAFSCAPLAHDIVGILAVNNTVGVLFGRGRQPRHPRTATGVMTHGY